jgi:hypothetical protein
MVRSCLVPKGRTYDYGIKSLLCMAYLGSIVSAYYKCHKFFKWIHMPSNYHIFPKIMQVFLKLV